MKTKLRQIGGSKGIIIPSKLLKEIDVEKDQLFTVIVERGLIILEKNVIIKEEVLETNEENNE